MAAAGAGRADPFPDGAGLPDLPGVRHELVRIEGGPAGELGLHVVRAEDGPGARAVVLLHGFPQHWWQWRHVIPPFALERPVVVLDLRGFGWSGTPGGPQRTDDHARDVLRVLDTLGLGRVHLVAHDWGAIVGFRLALEHPGRVASLLSLTVPHPWLRFHPRLLLLLRHAWFQPLVATPGLGPRLLGGGRQRVVRHLFEGFTAHEGAIGPDDVETYLERLREPARARAGSALYRQLILPELVGMLRGRYADARLAVPTVSLLGERDLVADERFFDDGGRARDLTVEVVPGAGHFLPEECPDVVLDRARALHARTA
ncbi:alpha/beta fold hydrolase [Isoptericola sp. BMS4]|uniref:alpha/beta fold hydrolase n=1 Tax=Isoptericola sp. BMS4 TaxID=2527875 RepID=UPI00196B8E25|nr:alpha/beta hydrolase [Isoptericola sp. BMS4]